MWDARRGAAIWQADVVPDMHVETVFFTLFIFAPGFSGGPQSLFNSNYPCDFKLRAAAGGAGAAISA
ncbi:hypothetical protein [Herbaspirillum sp. NPDC101397]|uniref:hypothetical protein n=1 Tax=Herbaspirillum sp. NPDC101397 TaxID=3364006 RepID=UPI00383B08EF